MADKQLSRIARFIDKRVDELASKKSQKEIAEQAGFPKPNIIVMFKQGTTKVPLDRVADLAKALEVEPGFLFSLALEQLYGEGSNPIAKIFNDIIPTKGEAALIKALRERVDQNKVGFMPQDPRDDAYGPVIEVIEGMLSSKQSV